ncbi:11520_t:CDS:2 [Dentiscutata erythropus]|uniref:11520_t:CDS:1 n=1 Tax=Dentiscutata erythropus TaxID=1348616 RepID=A0A9N9AJT7_9GLOM|nr:11520_t:CDS:2 [Dentiscutata erythropus]
MAQRNPPNLVNPPAACEDNINRSLNILFKLPSNSASFINPSLKLIEPLTSKASRSISPITIPPVNQNNSNCYNTQINNIVFTKLDNNTLLSTPVVSELFEELRHYTSQLKTQLGCFSNTLKNLNFIPSNSSTSSLVVIPEKTFLDILQPLPLNYIHKEIPLYLPNSNNPLPLVYYDTMTSSSDASPFHNKNSLNNMHVTSPSNNQQQFLTNTNPIKKRKIPKYKYNENNSDADSEINKIQRLTKLKKEKLKSPFTKCLYNLTGNAYFREEKIKLDLRGYI